MRVKMKVTLKEMMNHEFSKEIAGQHGKGVSRSLISIVKGDKVSFEVIDHGTVIRKTSSLAIAVEYFNAD